MSHQKTRFLRPTLALALFVAPCLAAADSIDLQVDDIAPGSPVRAGQMLERFSTIESAINENDIRIRDLEAPFAAIRYTVNSPQLLGVPDFLRIDFAQSTFDDQGLVSTGSAWCFDADAEGLFLVSSTLTVADNNIGFSAPFDLAVFLGDELYSRTTTFVNINEGFPSFSHSDLVLMEEGDCLNLRARHAGGSQRSTTASGVENYVSIVRVR